MKHLKNNKVNIIRTMVKLRADLMRAPVVVSKIKSTNIRICGF